MFVEPPDSPEKIPEALPIVATAVLLLLHVPPTGVPVSVCVLVAQIGVVAVNEGIEFTV
jgi:hypothetical protein